MYKVKGSIEASEAEWKHIFDQGTFDLDKVEPHKQVAQRYKDKGQQVHLGTVRELSHEKRSELNLEKSCTKDE